MREAHMAYEGCVKGVNAWPAEVRRRAEPPGPRYAARRRGMCDRAKSGMRDHMRRSMRDRMCRGVNCFRGDRKRRHGAAGKQQAGDGKSRLHHLFIHDPPHD
jgi:hypothetical protein